MRCSQYGVSTSYLSLGRWLPTQTYPVPTASLDDWVRGYQEVRVSGSLLGAAVLDVTFQEAKAFSGWS